MAKGTKYAGFMFENMTFFLMLICGLVFYLYIRVLDLSAQVKEKENRSQVKEKTERCARDLFTDPYAPPIRCDKTVLPDGLSQIPTQGYYEYTQMGILSRDETILPLMGRRLNRQNWQYYTLSGGIGNVQTKLPIRFKGKNAGEYCDEIMNHDDVFVEGYQKTFHATIYENGMYSYLPI